jgi:hypothetical protein
MDHSTTKRPWFQFHLSTAIILMFVASGLLGANLYEQPPLYLQIPFDDLNLSRGWPWIYYECYGRHRISGPWYNERWHLWPLLGDTAVGFATVFVTAILLEYRIRRQRRTVDE